MRCVEDALRKIRDKAAAIQFLADCAAESARVAEGPVFRGIADVCGEVASLADRIKGALDVDAVSRELRRRARPTGR